MLRASFVHAHAAAPDWQDALADCVGQLRTRIAAQHAAADAFTLGWCYLSDYFAPSAEAILETLQQQLPGIAWVGTAGVGVLASGVEYIDEAALVLMAAPLPAESFRLFSGRQPLATVSSDFIAHTALVHGEGSTPDIQDLLHELSERTTTGYLFGGLSSARNRTLHLADGVFTGGLSGVLFDSSVHLISRVTQGCQPIGPQRAITGSEGNYVITLDGRPALDCVLQDLGIDDELLAEELADALSATLVGISSGNEDVPLHAGKFGADTLVRHLVGVDLENRVLAVGDEVEAGSQLAFCKRHPEAARRDLQRIATEIRDELENGASGELAGALYVSCSGRGGPHFGARHAELRIVQDVLGDVPLVGFFAGGEIARDHLYGYTGVLTVFTTGT